MCYWGDDQEGSSQVNDDIRDQIARTLSATTTCHGDAQPSELHYRQADALLPLVAQLWTEGGVAALRDAATNLRHYRPDIGSHVPSWRLRDHANNLTTR